MTLGQNYGDQLSSMVLRSSGRLILAFIGLGVIFASLGLGEAVYRFLFLDFDGATDRLPIELFFGITFAWAATKLIRKIYHNRMEKIRLIQRRNYKIRHAVDAIAPVPHVGNQQAIRVIREEADRIDGALADIIAR
jgi:hypothetical protein